MYGFFVLSSFLKKSERKLIIRFIDFIVIEYCHFVHIWMFKSKIRSCHRTILFGIVKNSVPKPHILTFGMFQGLHIRFGTVYNCNIQTYILQEGIEIKIGYCRISSKSQKLDRQIVALKEQGVEKIFTETKSGKDKNRPKLKEMMEFIREGDTLVIESISRLARNTMDFLEIVNDLTDRKVEVISLKESIDTSTAQGKFICTIFGALYELERENTKQRQMEGIAVAKEKGVVFGRPAIEIDDNFMREYKRWKEGKQTAVATYKKLDISRTSFYRKVKQIEGSPKMNKRKLNKEEITTIS